MKNNSSTQEVYIAHCNGEMDAEQFSSILGVFHNQEDAKRALEADIADIKVNWRNINFEDEDDWSEEWDEDGVSYQGYTPCDDYYYEGSVDKYTIQ